MSLSKMMHLFAHPKEGKSTVYQIFCGKPALSADVVAMSVFFIVIQ